ncbi:PH, RCC1 and FYVE domains-containing protein 1-like [Silene latifolia]|uniref:PH, RCC1 and FYVE domains-containing protein 1-like n=1 Tax=Silene latifolia TaxID=37657 RepID=UPI003D7862D3
MADLASYGLSDRDIDQALIALKKGTHLIKYSRKGKPKFCPFRLSTDEATLIWISHGEERTLKLSLVSRIIPGQRTAVFRRYLRPEKDYLSFSLIYNNGDRSLDLICKDKAEAEVWLAGLKSIISTGQQRSKRTRSEIPDWNDADSIQNGRPFGAALEFTSTLRGRASLDFGSSADVGSEQAIMQLRGSTGDGFRLSTDGVRLSVSSTPSCSSTGSGPDDIESLGDVYVWGELWTDSGPYSTKTDVLIPKPLESNVVLDVHQIACGVRHVALVTRQGEVFTWGEEAGGRLGHGVERDVSKPQLVEFLAVTNVDFVACGEYHSCAVSTSGDLFTWGDGVHNAGLLGHGTDASHWIPKRVSGPIEGLQVLSISCGTWHSALTTTNGKLFTFGDGTFGVLGHGDRESVSYPKEVEQLNGLKTIKVACGVWHTAAIVEVMNPSGSGSSICSRKLFTWGDGDKYRLGHGNKDTYLLPTCVSSLIDYNFHQIACGHTFTVALTTSGHVFTMGSSANGQLGNPQAEGKVPCLVQEKLVGEFVEEITCGECHVAVLTSRSEVYTWGKGSNGRLGHGDIEDRKTPTYVEALKDRHVKSIACGSNFTSTICIHKWVSGADQSVCSGCRQAFGFTKKRHNCYNCGLVHCHACSSKKAVRAALAPTPSKPHRVCDACYNKLKATATGNASFFSKRPTAPRRSIDSCRERLDKPETKGSRLLLSPTTEPVKYLEVRTQRFGTKSDSFAMVRQSQVPAFQQLKDIAFPSSLSALQTALKPSTAPPPPPPALYPSSSSARPASPYSRRPSPPRSTTPVFSRGVNDSLRKSNELLSQEVAKLHNHLKNLKQKCDFQEEEIQTLQKMAKEASVFAAEQSSKSKVATQVVKSFAGQLKDIVDKVSPESSESEDLKAMQTQALAFVEASENEALDNQTGLTPPLESGKPNLESTCSTKVRKTISLDPTVIGDLSQPADGNIVQDASQEPSSDTTETVAKDKSEDGGVDADADVPPPPVESESSDRHGSENGQVEESQPPPSPSPEVDSTSNQGKENGQRISPGPTRGEGSRESIEQFEPGVYITYIQLRNGTKVFRRVRFSKRRFAETQAEEWWKGNRDRVLRKYVPPPPNNATATASTTTPPAAAAAAAAEAAEPAAEVTSNPAPASEENNDAMPSET